MKKFLSSLERPKTLDLLAKENYDVLIIGGGITGAGVALDASSRGLKTALIEMQDFSAGTSSRSTKLIHGGLRYLEQFRFKLVRDVGKERKILYRNAPYLVYPEKMLIPILKNGKYKKWKIALGIWIYDLLAGVEEKEKRKILNAKSIQKIEPLLFGNLNLISGCIYTEYQTDDARLVIEVLKTACEYGAECINYVKAENFICAGNKITGIEISDQLTNNRYLIKAKQVINATGPWVDKVRLMDNQYHEARLHHTKGVHIVVSSKVFPLNNPVYFEGTDGRMIFAIPRRSCVFIGTTDTNYNQALEAPAVTVEDKNYLLKGINKMFPSLSLAENQIQSSWAGIRPLIHQEGKKPSEISRKEEIFLSKSGLISIAGGKLTGYRQMAEKITDLVMKNLGKKEKSQTRKLPLIGNKWKNKSEVETYIADLAATFKLSTNEVKELVCRYGKNAEQILKKALEYNNEEFALLRSEIWYCKNYEAAVNAEDFLTRRTGKAYFEKVSEKELKIIEDNFEN